MTSNNVTAFKIIGFLIFILLAIIANTYWNRENAKANDFLKSLNLNLTLKVIDVKPTNDHGYGVIFGKVVKSNKPVNYSAIYRQKYTFCKMLNGNALFVSDYYVFEKNDSVVINSNIAKYWIYRNGKLISEYNLTNTTDDFLYSHLQKNKYLDFETYRN